jgi:hypothetical protein
MTNYLDKFCIVSHICSSNQAHNCSRNCCFDGRLVPGKCHRTGSYRHCVLIWYAGKPYVINPGGKTFLNVLYPGCERNDYVALYAESDEVARSATKELRQGSGTTAPSGVQRQSPLQGARGAELPGNFWPIFVQHKMIIDQ